MRLPDEFISELAVRIHRLGVSESAVMRQAGMNARYFSDIQAGRRVLTRKCYDRMTRAIAHLQASRAVVRLRADQEDKCDAQAVCRDPFKNPVMMQYRLILLLVCRVADVPAQKVLVEDPSRRATANADWMRAAQLRRIAIYIANVCLKMKQADIARAAGLSRAAVCGLLKDVEDLRGDRQVETMIAAVEEVLI